MHMTDTPIEQQALGRNTRRILGTTVLMAQLPLALHLPWWISLPGMLLVLLKVLPAFDRDLVKPLFMTPLVLLAAFGIIFHYGQFFDRDPCVAFLFLLVGFKFAESRRIYDASLVIILCAFLLMTQFFYWQSLVSAILSVPAIFFIGLSFFSLQRGTAELEMRLMVHITSRLLLQAVPVAMLLFVVVPRITTPGWSGSEGENSLTGLSSRMSPGSIAELSKSNEVAFRVEFDTLTPSPADLYWRGPVLSGYDGNEWFILPSRISNYLLQPNTADTDSTIGYTVTMEPTNNPWLLALDTPASLPREVHRSGESETIAYITSDRQLNSIKPLDRITRYQSSSTLTDRFSPTTLPGAENLLTTQTNPKAMNWAKQLRTQHADDENLVRHILRWFNTEPFYYTLNPPALGRHSIDDFLFDSRRGFCEHYAGSFVFLLRAAGIPARVVTGYQGGELNDSYMIVRQSDAHAWAEAFIDGQWRRFDPTAAVAPQRIENGMRETLQGERNRGFLSQFQPSWVKSVQLKWDSANYAWQHLVIGFDATRQNAIWNKLGFEQPGALMIVLLVLAAVGLWMAAIMFPWSMFVQPKVDPCERQWQRFCRKFAKMGMKRMTGEAPDAYVSRLIQQWPQKKRPMYELLTAYQTGRFSRTGQQRQHQLVQAREMKTALNHMQRIT